MVETDIKKAQPQNQIHNQRRFHQPSAMSHQQAQQDQTFGTGFGWGGAAAGGREDYANMAAVAAAGSWRDQRQNGYQSRGGYQNSATPGAQGGHRGYHRGRVYSATTYGNGGQNYGY